MRARGIRRPQTGVANLFVPAVKALAPDAPATTHAIAGAVDEPSAIFLVRLTGLAKAISASEGCFVLDFAHGTTMLSGSIFIFPGTFTRLVDVLP